MHLVDDSPSLLPNAHGFKEHRHDQSIFSLLMHIYDQQIENRPSPHAIKPSRIVTHISRFLNETE